jgi:hypothetical protein
MDSDRSKFNEPDGKSNPIMKTFTGFLTDQFPNVNLYQGWRTGPLNELNDLHQLNFTDAQKRGAMILLELLGGRDISEADWRFLHSLDKTGTPFQAFRERFKAELPGFAWHLLSDPKADT